MPVEIKTLFQLYGREKSLKVALKATRELRALLDVKDEQAKLSPKAQKLKEKCISFGPSGPKWAAICSLLIEEDIMIKDCNLPVPFIRFAGIVPNPTDGNYPAHSVMFMVVAQGAPECPDSVRGIRQDGCLGGNVRPNQKLYKVASDAKVESAINAIFDLIGDDKIDF